MEGNSADLGQLLSTMPSIELACTSIQMQMNLGAAEATILALSQTPQPYQTCKYILENSQGAKARFQAATAIRDAAIREWGFLSSDEKKSMIWLSIISETYHLFKSNICNASPVWES